MKAKFSPQIVLMEISKECRSTLYDDILEKMPLLYKVLYSNKDSKIFRVYQELYDLNWLNLHWDKLSEYIRKHKLGAIQKGEILSLFAGWYCSFIEHSSMDKSLYCNNILLMKEVLELKITDLESIIEFNKRCELNIARIETSFMESIKLMQDKLEEFKPENRKGV